MPFQISLADPNIPVERDHATRQIFLAPTDGGYGIPLLMNFCYRCGGRLPPLRKLFKDVDMQEFESVCRLMEHVQSLDQARTLLGEPDRVLEDGPERWVFTDLPGKTRLSFCYDTAFRSLVLWVYETEDGSLRYYAHGKPLFGLRDLRLD
jgi:hypothetical protein